MKRFGGIGFVWSIVAVLAACSGESGSGTVDASTDGRVLPIDDASPGETGAADAGALEASAEASVDASRDASIDATADASIDAADAAPPPQPAVSYIGRWAFSGGHNA